MTKLNPTINTVNVVFPNERTGNGVNHQYHHKSGVPIRFVPVETLCYDSTGQVGWYGSTWELYKTKTGKLLCSLTEWSCVDGEADRQTNIVTDSPSALFAALENVSGTAASRVREWLSTKHEVVATI